MSYRGYDPAQVGSVQNVKVPQLNEMGPTAGAPSVVSSPARVSGRGADQPVARPGGVSGQVGTRPSGITVEPSPARVRGRGSDQPHL